MPMCSICTSWLMMMPARTQSTSPTRGSSKSIRASADLDEPESEPQIAEDMPERRKRVQSNTFVDVSRAPSLWQVPPSKPRRARGASPRKAKTPSRSLSAEFEVLASLERAQAGNGGNRADADRLGVDAVDKINYFAKGVGSCRESFWPMKIERLPALSDFDEGRLEVQALLESHARDSWPEKCRLIP